MTSKHGQKEDKEDEGVFYTYSALLIESGLTECLNNILLTPEVEFEGRNEEEDSVSLLLKAKEESLNILINLSCNGDPHASSIVKRGTLDVLCH